MISYSTHPLRTVLAVLFTLWLAGCVGPLSPFSGGERNAVFANGMICLKPARTITSAVWPAVEPTPREVPPLSLLEQAGYLSCRAHQLDVLTSGQLRQAISDMPGTLLKAEQARFLALNGRADTGWVPHSRTLHAACSGVALISDTPDDAKVYCLWHFPQILRGKHAKRHTK